MRLLAPILAAILISSCGLVYKIDIQQGNYVTQDLVAKLKVGMTKGEVRLLLGTPLLIDAFHSNRWDYYFSNVKSGKSEDRTRLSVFFENDKVVSFSGDARPAAQPSVATPMEPRRTDSKAAAPK